MTEPTAIKHRLLNSNFGVASFKYNRWSATLSEAQTLEDALEPTFWSAQAEHMMGHDKRGGRLDIIEVRKPDSGLYAELIVEEIGKGYVKVRPLRLSEPQPTKAISDSSPFETRWNVGNKCHEVVRKADKQVMRGGFQSKAGAADWIAEHMKAMAA